MTQKSINQLLVQVHPELAPSLELTGLKDACEALASDITGVVEY
jgi:hypothetical protein